MVDSLLSNARWIALSRGTSIVVQLLGLVWLARLLDPRDYGLVAMATVVTNLAELVRDLGFAMALIQREKLTDDAVNTAFWFTFVIGIALGIAVALLAPLVALAYGEPRVTGLLLTLALTFPILGLTTVHKALLERTSRFREVVRIEIISAIAGLGAGVGAAYSGAGPYSLVIGTLTLASASSLQFWYTNPLRPRLSWSRPEFRLLRKFGDYLAGFNIVNYLANNADSMLIGRFLGADSLGIYSISQKIMLFPINNLTRAASRAAYPIMSRQQAAADDMTALYMRTLRLVAFFTAPIAAGLLVLREPLTDVFLGDRWSAVADVLIWLAPVTYLKSIFGTTGPLMMAHGRTDLLFRLSLLDVTVRISCIAVGLRWGIQGVAAGYLVATAIQVVPVLRAVLKLTKGSARALLLLIILPPSIAAIMVAILTVLRQLLTNTSIADTIQLALLVAAGGGVYLLLSILVARQSVEDILRFFWLRGARR